MTGSFIPKRKFHRYTHHAHGYKASPRRLSWCFSISAMHLVCKPISAEYLSFLYSRVEFWFASPNWLLHFCTTGSRIGLHYVRKVRLAIITHGQPEKMRDVVFVGKHYGAWEKAVRKMIEEMPNLEEVDIKLRVTDSPLIFTFREPWAALVLQLRALEHLKRARVTLWSRAVKSHWDWDDITVEQNSAAWVALTTSLHAQFANALALRIEGKPERAAVYRYRASVMKELATEKGAALMRRLMGYMWVQEARRWDWVE
jgi:hypothetical protein